MVEAHDVLHPYFPFRLVFLIFRSFQVHLVVSLVILFQSLLYDEPLPSCGGYVRGRLLLVYVVFVTQQPPLSPSFFLNECSALTWLLTYLGVGLHFLETGAPCLILRGHGSLFMCPFSFPPACTWASLTPQYLLAASSFRAQGSVSASLPDPRGQPAPLSSLVVSAIVSLYHVPQLWLLFACLILLLLPRGLSSGSPALRTWRILRSPEKLFLFVSLWDDWRLMLGV